MTSGILSIVFIIVVGVILAEVLINYRGTQTVFNGITDLWKTSINGLLGKSSS